MTLQIGGKVGPDIVIDVAQVPSTMPSIKNQSTPSAPPPGDSGNGPAVNRLSPTPQSPKSYPPGPSGTLTGGQTAAQNRPGNT